MKYGIIIQGPKEDPVWTYGETPPAIGPQVFDAMVDSVVDSLGICRLCDVQGRRCHVIEEGTGRKFCPILFHDVVRPKWKVDDIV